MGAHPPDLSFLMWPELVGLRIKSASANGKEVGSSLGARVIPPRHTWGTAEPTTESAHPLHGSLSVGLGVGLAMLGLHTPSEGKEKVALLLLEPGTKEHINQTSPCPILESISPSLSLSLSVSLSFPFSSSQPTKSTNQITPWGPENSHSSAPCKPTLVPFTLQGCRLICKMPRAKIIPIETFSPNPQRIKTDPAAHTLARFALVSRASPVSLCGGTESAWPFLHL